MGMFDTVVVKVALPVPEELRAKGFGEGTEDYQTKDLDNSLGLYEISAEGRLMHLDQERAWVADDKAFLGGYFEVQSEEWKDTHYHGNLFLYTSFCEDPAHHWDYGKGAEQMSWDDILKIDTHDWWVEFVAIFSHGHLQEIKLHKAEKTPIRMRLGGNKQWAENMEKEERKFPACLSRHLRRIPGWRGFVRSLSKIEQKTHDKVSRFLLKIS
jgi:hypothetical protein